MASTVSRRPPSSRRTAPAIRASAPRSPARPRAAGSHPRGVGGVGSPAPAPRRRLGGLTTSPVPRGPPGRRAVWRRGAAAARKQAREPRARAPRALCTSSDQSAPPRPFRAREYHPLAGPRAHRQLRAAPDRSPRADSPELRRANSAVSEKSPRPDRTPAERRNRGTATSPYRIGGIGTRTRARHAGAKKIQRKIKNQNQNRLGEARLTHAHETKAGRRRLAVSKRMRMRPRMEGGRARACALMGAHPSEPSRGRASAVRRRRRRERGEGAPASQRARDPHACQPCRTGSSSVRCARAPGCRRSCARRERGREGERAAAAAGVRPAAAVRRFAEVSCALRAQPPPTRARVGC